LTPIRRIARIGGFVAITSAMLPAFVIRKAIASPGQRDRVRDSWVRAWSGSLLRLFSIAIEVEGPEAASDPSLSTKGRLVVANHRSAIDIAVLLRIFGGHMVSRADLSKWPLVGAAAHSVGTIFVDRLRTTSGVGAIREIQRHLEEGQTIILFPEGTTFEGDIVRPFHAGAFMAALLAGASVVPVGLAYPVGSQTAFVNEPFARHLSRMAGTRATRVAVRVGRAIRAARGVRASELSATSQNAVQSLVYAARVAVDRPDDARHTSYHR
jgi:lyso-ornithine lipid O-acyltransferase